MQTYCELPRCVTCGNFFLIKVSNYRREKFTESFFFVICKEKFIVTTANSSNPCEKTGRRILCSRKAFIPKSTNSCSRVFTPSQGRKRKLLIFPELSVFSLERDQHFSDGNYVKPEEKQGKL